MENAVDYVVVFRAIYKYSDIYMYQLMTAYPVVLPEFKRRFALGRLALTGRWWE